jgi:LmbE family N-acetylglucosaminyl deacetylase
VIAPGAKKPEKRKAEGIVVTDPENHPNVAAISAESPEPETPPGEWEKPQKILVLLAHPDDPEFFCGATLARWAKAGHEIVYCLITCGDKGTQDTSITRETLCGMRVEEQNAAAAVIGVKRVRFLGYPDGYVVPDLGLRKEITRVVRQEKPDIVVTCDPTTLYSFGTRLNHPDHRAAGQVVLDAIFPAVGNPMYFEDLRIEEGLEPHQVKEVWVSLSLEPNVILDVTDYWETKINALYQHKSQIGEPEKLAERMRERHTEDSTPENPRYEERFRRLMF